MQELEKKIMKNQICIFENCLVMCMFKFMTFLMLSMLKVKYKNISASQYIFKALRIIQRMAN